MFQAFFVGAQPGTTLAMDHSMVLMRYERALYVTFGAYVGLVPDCLTGTLNRSFKRACVYHKFGKLWVLPHSFSDDVILFIRELARIQLTEDVLTSESKQTPLPFSYSTQLVIPLITQNIWASTRK